MADPTTENTKLTFIQSVQRNFLTGLFLLLPLILSVYILVWLYTTITAPTVQVLKQLFPELQGGTWALEMSVFAFCLNITLVIVVGLLTRYVIGRRIFLFFEALVSQVPVLSKVYGGVKQIVQGFSLDKKAVFQKVVLVEFPTPNSRVIGFVTGSADRVTDGEPSWYVFVPTTPNPTSGFLIVVKVRETREVDLSVGDAIKMIISGGTLIPSTIAGRSA